MRSFQCFQNQYLRYKSQNNIARDSERANYFLLLADVFTIFTFAFLNMFCRTQIYNQFFYWFLLTFSLFFTTFRAYRTFAKPIKKLSFTPCQSFVLFIHFNSHFSFFSLLISHCIKLLYMRVEWSREPGRQKFFL